MNGVTIVQDLIDSLKPFHQTGLGVLQATISKGCSIKWVHEEAMSDSLWQRHVIVWVKSTHLKTISAYFQMVASECPDQELESTVQRWKEWDLGETRHEVIETLK